MQIHITGNIYILFEFNNKNIVYYKALIFSEKYEKYVYLIQKYLLFSLSDTSTFVLNSIKVEIIYSHEL
jgi:hypothetical protein